METSVTIQNNDINLKDEDINLKDENIKNINNNLETQQNKKINLRDLSVQELKELLDEEMEKYPFDEEDEQELLDYIDDMIYPKSGKVIKK